jgi:uncharacterized repeat protein (TIGR01451 family)
MEFAMSSRRLLALPLALAAAAAASAAPGPLEVTSSMLVEARTRAVDGTTAIRLVTPARVVPGDRVTVAVRYRNTGAQPLSGLVIANPVPAGLRYRGPAADSVQPEVSVDGERFGALASLQVRGANGASRPATPDDVTAVRWRLPQPVAAGGAGQLAFQAVLK